jgi:hypothetical protein
VSEPTGRAEPLAGPTGIRNLVGMAVAPDGGVLLAGGKLAAVLRYDGAGQVTGRWSLEDLQAVAVDSRGLAFAAAGDRVYFLEQDQSPRPVASLGEFSPVTSLAVDGIGRFWVLDRRGERIGRIDPGSGQVVAVGSEQRSKLESMIWDGARLLALNPREKAVVRIDEEGGLTTVAGQGLLKPVGLAADPAGRLAVLDGRADAILLFDLLGEPLGSIAWIATGVEKPASLALGWDGAPLLFDDSSQRCMRVP